MKFTDLSVKAAQPKAKDYFIREGLGFALKVTPAGRKVFVVIYDYAGKRKRLTLGTYPGLTLAAARKQHREARAAIELGRDPAAEKQAAKKQIVATNLSPTVSDLIRSYTRLHVEVNLAPNTQRQEKHYLTRINRDMGPLHLTEVTPKHCNNCYQSLAESSPVSGNRCLSVIKRLFKFSVGQGDLTFSPAVMLSGTYKEKPRDRALSMLEVERLWLALNPDDPRHQAIKLLLLTAVRKMELLHAPRVEFDLDGGIWTIPGSRTKNSRLHVLPLPPLAVSIIRELMQFEDSKWLFPSPRNAARPVSDDFLKLKNLPVVDGVAAWTPHDLRRTVATRLSADFGASRIVQDKLLNHVDRSVSAIYDKNNYFENVKEIIGLWGSLLGQIR